MTSTLSVHVNRSHLHGIEVEPDVFESVGDFFLELANHGQAVHVHLLPDDDLARAVRLEETNHFIDGDTLMELPIEVDRSQLPCGGKLKIVSGYGAETKYVDVHVRPPEPNVDEPEPEVVVEPSAPSIRERLADRSALLVGGLSLVAVLLAGIALSVATTPFVAIGVIAVLLALVTAAYLLVE